MKIETDSSWLRCMASYALSELEFTPEEICSMLRISDSSLRTMKRAYRLRCEYPELLSGWSYASVVTLNPVRNTLPDFFERMDLESGSNPSSRTVTDKVKTYLDVIAKNDSTMQILGAGDYLKINGHYYPLTETDAQDILSYLSIPSGGDQHA